MLKSTFLNPGDKVAIVSTARKITLAEIQDSLEILKSWGLVPVLGKTIGLEQDQFAGNDRERADDFQRMLDDDEIKAIWCARGGYGTVRIIDHLDFSKFIKNPKWIIGYSDISVLHSHLNNLGIASIHGPMPVDLHKCSREAIESFRQALFGKLNSVEIKGSKMNRTGEAKGQLVGGNLSILYSLCGSRSSLDTAGKILCIEDLDEYLYHLDRMLQNLKRNGYFEQLNGLIVGGMTKMHDNNIPFGKTALEIIEEVVKDYDFPVAYEFPFGHIEDNRTLLLGTEAELVVGEEQVKLSYI
ncbi:MAG: LD-carboxypeptidase [Aquimarina sp.]|nr:LD-carboxypeptidase [Aquimarina sp.]